MKYFVIYTEMCGIKLKQFKTKQQRDLFILQFLLESQINEDNFIDFIGEGKVDFVGDGIQRS